ncbi:hypothetical protein I4I73_13360 [Pseudonocardia sp. KRD-184]|uniref:Uncharacterized protein n=1 Tax=Pseudonocardia oceani TaxID=2792013 RepID=A0ABS6UHM3_9PSEU|nr:hypothetical protein [Pseudonocardia oceani]MBW0096976.1 hypothetical protein [Pseudonocardia oceani]MBW0109651.1 hypothetical protein [Pseudonocardia oceani]MBW0122493.1 hypothetical protein [Pseudonocardia oceani]MBW0131687.1 hypothetical protein [Pseudonocardia oceani]
MSGPCGPYPPDPAAGPVLDPRDAGEQLHRAAELLRRTAAGRARGPWRWADPDPEAGAAELLDRPTSLKDLPFPPRPTVHPGLREPGADVWVGGPSGDPTADRVRDPAVPGPRGPGSGAAIDPVLAGPLADLLDALGRQVAEVVDAGGSLRDEPFRSALRLAGAVVGGRGEPGR